ncbi:hypothetical protein [Thiolapillus sp.]|uniref:hypothetical protein n=2 Tax=Thiolapillus sp. TaxID=2017437 RepID=UPI0025E34A58|nr:hypothetical protein [Thiolapillus sp.]
MRPRGYWGLPAFASLSMAGSERLCASGKMTADSRALFQAMLMLLEVLMVVFMEKRTPKNSTNSSKPSSQTPKDDTATTHPGANSKGNQHNGIRCGNTRTIETVQTSPITQCETCGEDLSKTPCQKFERRIRIDIIFEKVVTHVDAEIKQCPQ